MAQQEVHQNPSPPLVPQDSLAQPVSVLRSPGTTAFD